MNLSENEKNNIIELIKRGRYKIMVKVIDIVGVDTSQIIEVEINKDCFFL